MKSLFKRLGLLAALFLSACASTEIQNMPANQLVGQGIGKAFDMPNYRFVASSGLDEFKMNLGTKSGKDKDMESFLTSFMSNMIKNLSFEAVGVIDSPNKMYQLIPSYRYDSKNLKGMAAFPLVYDGNKKHLFADLSAMDMLFNSPEHSGKYSDFDLNKFAKHLDKSSKIMDVLKKNTMGHYEGLEQASFSEVPLNDEDKSNRVVRKVQVKTTVQKSLELLPNLMNDMVNVFKPDAAEAPSPATAAPADGSEALAKSPIFGKDMMDRLTKMIAPGSEQTEVLGFNNKGEVIQSDMKARIVLKNPKPDDEVPESKEPIVMGMHSKMRLYDIGTAKLVDAPTPENSVDGVENLKKSAVGRLVVGLLTDGKSVKDADEHNGEADLASGHAVEAAAAAAADAAMAAPERRPARKPSHRKH